MASSSGLWRRPAASSSPLRPPAGGPLRPDVDPPPKARPVFQLLAFAVIVFLACLQFLPATHFRHPSDPLRTWIPKDAPSNSNAPDGEQSNILNDDVKAEKIHIISWTDCLDLRVLAVLANSTLSSSRVANHVYFHFFVPEDEDRELSYYKLKVLLPHANLEIIGQKEVKEKLRTVLPGMELQWLSLRHLTPLIIPSISPTLNRFIYVYSDTMIKGNIEDLFGIDLGPYAIAAAEDCHTRLGDCVNTDILDAIQRTAAKSWVSDEPYDKNACLPDFSVFLLDARKLDKLLLEAILWWNKVLNMQEERSNQISPAIALALYNRYYKLPSTWKLANSILPKLESETSILHYDGPRRACSEHSNQHQQSDIGSIWRQYLPPKSDAILAH